MIISSESTEEATTAKVDEQLIEEEEMDDDKDEDWKAEKKTPKGPSKVRHMLRRTPKTETEEKAGVKCDRCHQIFKTDEYLKQHMQIHQRINYHCPECDRPFSVKRYIYNHMKTMHGKDYNASIQIKMTPYVPSDCSECKETFPSAEMLEIHMDREHRSKSEKQARSKSATPKSATPRTSQRIRKATEKVKNNTEGSEIKEKVEEDETVKAEKDMESGSEEKYPFVCRICQKGFNLRRSIGVHMRKSHDLAYQEEGSIESEKEEVKDEDELLPISLPAAADSVDEREDGVIMTRSGRKSKKTSKLLESESPSKMPESPKKFSSEKSTPKGNLKSNVEDIKGIAEKKEENADLEHDNTKENQSDEKPDYTDESGKVMEEENKTDDLETNVIEEMKEDEEIHESEEEYNPNESENGEDDDDDFKPKASRSTPKGLRGLRGIKRKSIIDEGIEVDGVLLTTPGRKKRKDSKWNIPQQRITNQNLLVGRCEETVVDNKVWYKCLLCSKTMRMRTAIIKHLKTHDEMLEGSYQCYICDVRFSTNFKLGNHLRDVHKKLNAFECEKCKLRFSGRKAFIEHEAICNVDPDSVAPQPLSEEELKIQITCLFCKQEFQAKEEKEEHENTHVNESGAFLCPHCDLTFLEKSFCKLHILTIHSPEDNMVEEKNVNPLQCRLCLKILNTQETYDTHMKIHEDESLVCKICNKRFNYPYTLRNHHMLHHSEDFAFLCPYCPQKFKLKRYMTKHVSDKHEGDTKPKEKSDMETCKVCDTPYISKVELLEHMKETHEHVINTHRKVTDDPEKFGCARCHKVYNTVDDFIIHVSNHRPKKKLVCVHCGNTFNTKSNLNTHV